MRIKSPQPYPSSGGWKHRLDRGVLHELARTPAPPPRPKIDAAAVWNQLRIQGGSRQWATAAAFAAKLGVSAKSLFAPGLGWSQGHGAWAFPMRTAYGEMIGFRLRDARTGKKFCWTGSREGVFFPPRQTGISGMLAIVEGPTDLAAALDLGYSALGRPSCASGDAYTLAYLSLHRTYSTALIVADRDEHEKLPYHPGQDGAVALAKKLRESFAHDLRIYVFLPPKPHKDLRAWRCADRKLRGSALWSCEKLFTWP